MWKNLLLILLSLLFTVTLSEAFLRWHVPPIAGVSFSEYDPTYGKVVKKNARGYRIRPEYTTIITTNSLGLRGPDLFREWPNDAVLFLGDSFTFGVGVSDGEEYPQLIAQRMKEDPKFQHVPVLNLGIGDNGNGRWLKFLREKGDSLSPKLIVLQLHFTDFTDNLNEQSFRIGEKDELIELSANQAKKRVQSLQEIVELIPGVDRLYLVGLLRHLYSTANQSAQKSPDHMETDTAGSDRLTYRIIENILKLCRNKSWPLLSVMIDIEGQRKDRLTSLFATYNVSFVHLPSKKQAPDWYYEIDGHWTPKGHRLAVERIFPELYRRLVSPQ
jgi:lysophospholipase L1-like esterase